MSLSNDPGEENKGADSDEFEFYFPFARTLALDLSTPEDKSIAAAWVQKLEVEPESEEEKQTRLNYLKLLLFVLQRGRLSGIFRKQPPTGSLQPFPQGLTILDMGNMILDQDDSPSCGQGDARCVPYSIEISNDLREFVASQEIPNFGVQMYYAWSSDEPIHKWLSFDEEKFPQYILDKIKQLKEIRSDEKATIVKNGCITLKKGCDIPLLEKISRKKVKSPQEIEKQGRSFHTYVGLVNRMGNFDKCDDLRERFQRAAPQKNACEQRPAQRPMPGGGEAQNAASEEECANQIPNALNRPCFCPDAPQQFEGNNNRNNMGYGKGGSQPCDADAGAEPKYSYNFVVNPKRLDYTPQEPGPDQGQYNGGQCADFGMAQQMQRQFQRRNQSPRPNACFGNRQPPEGPPQDNCEDPGNAQRVCICTSPCCTCPCPRMPNQGLVRRTTPSCNIPGGGGRPPPNSQPLGNQGEENNRRVYFQEPGTCPQGNRDNAGGRLPLILHCFSADSPDPTLFQVIGKPNPSHWPDANAYQPQYQSQPPGPSGRGYYDPNQQPGRPCQMPSQAQMPAYQQPFGMNFNQQAPGLMEQRPCPQAFMEQRPCSQAPMEQRPCPQAFMDQRPYSQVPMEQRPCPQAFMEQRPCSQAPMEQRPCSQAPMEQRPCPPAAMEQRIPSAGQRNFRTPSPSCSRPCEPMQEPLPCRPKQAAFNIQQIAHDYLEYDAPPPNRAIQSRPGIARKPTSAPCKGSQPMYRPKTVGEDADGRGGMFSMASMSVQGRRPRTEGPRDQCNQESLTAASYCRGGQVLFGDPEPEPSQEESSYSSDSGPGQARPPEGGTCPRQPQPTKATKCPVPMGEAGPSSFSQRQQCPRQPATYAKEVCSVEEDANDDDSCAGVYDECSREIEPKFEIPTYTPPKSSRPVSQITVQNIDPNVTPCPTAGREGPASRSLGSEWTTPPTSTRYKCPREGAKNLTAGKSALRKTAQTCDDSFLNVPGPSHAGARSRPSDARCSIRSGTQTMASQRSQRQPTSQDVCVDNTPAPEEVQPCPRRPSPARNLSAANIPNDDWNNSRGAWQSPQTFGRTPSERCERGSSNFPRSGGSQLRQEAPECSAPAPLTQNYMQSKPRRPQQIKFADPPGECYAPPPADNCAPQDSSFFANARGNTYAEKSMHYHRGPRGPLVKMSSPNPWMGSVSRDNFEDISSVNANTMIQELNQGGALPGFETERGEPCEDGAGNETFNMIQYYNQFRTPREPSARTDNAQCAPASCLRQGPGNAYQPGNDDEGDYDDCENASSDNY